MTASHTSPSKTRRLSAFSPGSPETVRLYKDPFSASTFLLESLGTHVKTFVPLSSVSAPEDGLAKIPYHKIGSALSNKEPHRPPRVTLLYPWILSYETLWDLEPDPGMVYMRMMAAEAERILNHLSLFADLSRILACGPFETRISYSLDYLQSLVWSCLENKVSPLYPFLSFKRDKVLILKNLKAMVKEAQAAGGHALRFLSHFVVKDRCRDLGVLNKKEALAHGLTGPSLRASGVPADLRKDCPYDYYEGLSFEVPVQEGGDCHSRYMLRALEILESAKMLSQMEKLYQESHDPAPSMVLPPSPLERLEAFAAHSDRPAPLPHPSYHQVEAPEGIYGIFTAPSAGDGLKFQDSALLRLFSVSQAARNEDVSDLGLITTSLGFSEGRRSL